MKVFGLAGWSGSGKTTLLVKLIPELVGRGITVSTIKHAHHKFDVDKPGKDSYEHRQAGASEVLISSSNRWALMHELRGAPEPSLDELISHMSPVDLLMVEGFKYGDHPKLEVHRPSEGKPLLAVQDDRVVAIACDDELTEAKDCRRLDLNDVPAIANFILDYCGLQKEEVRHGAAD